MAADATSGGCLVGVDWGTSRLRAWLFDARGDAIAEAASDDGIGRLQGGHQDAFEKIAAGWPQVPAIMAGMVGSRQGWREVPYLPCPATINDLASAMTLFETGRGRTVAIVPGLKATRGDGDVLRGEETQAVGLIDEQPAFSGMAILPGTHSKWVRVDTGTIVGFQSFLSGELFDLLSGKSLLRHSVRAGPDDASDAPQFRLAVTRMAVEERPFLAALFPVRVRQLLGGIDPVDNFAYLSGLVIGGEIAAARANGALSAGMPIRVIGSQALARAYRAALGISGFAAEICDGSALVRAGLLHLARSTGLLGGKPAA